MKGIQSDWEEAIDDHLRKDDHAIRQLYNIFNEADTHGCGEISQKRFNKLLGDRRIKAHLGAIGVEINQARDVFMLLDVDQSGSLSIDEFIFGCLRVKGGARCV